MAKTPCTSALILISSQPHYIVGKWQTQGGRTPALFFVYAAQFLEALSSETGPLSSLSPGGTSFNIQNPIPYKSQKTGFFLKHAGQKSTKEELPEQRKASKRAVECQLKVQTHIWEHDVGCSSHLTPTRKSRRGNAEVL